MRILVTGSSGWLGRPWYLGWLKMGTRSSAWTLCHRLIRKSSAQSLTENRCAGRFAISRRMRLFTPPPCTSPTSRPIQPWIILLLVSKGTRFHFHNGSHPAACKGGRDAGEENSADGI
jgi:hypothetical protein